MASYEDEEKESDIGYIYRVSGPCKFKKDHLKILSLGILFCSGNCRGYVWYCNV